MPRPPPKKDPDWYSTVHLSSIIFLQVQPYLVNALKALRQLAISQITEVMG